MDKNYFYYLHACFCVSSLNSLFGNLNEVNLKRKIMEQYKREITKQINKLNEIQSVPRHRYIKPLFLVLGRGLAQFKRYLNIIKCVLECPLDLHIYPFSRTKGGKIFREYLIYCFWVRLSGRKSHQLPTKLKFSPINMTDKLFEKLSNQFYSNFS